MRETAISQCLENSSASTASLIGIWSIISFPPLFINYPTIYLQITINSLMKALGLCLEISLGSLHDIAMFGQVQQESNCGVMNGKICRKIAVYDARVSGGGNNSNLHLFGFCVTTFDGYVIRYTPARYDDWWGEAFDVFRLFLHTRKVAWFFWEKRNERKSFVGRKAIVVSIIVEHSRALIRLKWFACLSDRRINNFILSPLRIPQRGSLQKNSYKVYINACKNNTENFLSSLFCGSTSESHECLCWW